MAYPLIELLATLREAEVAQAIAVDQVQDGENRKWVIIVPEGVLSVPQEEALRRYLPLIHWLWESNADGDFLPPCGDKHNHARVTEGL